MDPVTIASIVAMLAGAGVQAYSADRSAKKQEDALRQSRARQMQEQEAATRVASKQAEQFDPTTRQQAQNEIAQQLTDGYQQQVQGPQITAQGVQVGTSIPQGQGGTDYLVSQGREQAKTASSLRALAALMGRTGSAGELRQREAIGFGDAAGQVGRIQTGAGNLWEIDQAGVAAAGRPNIGAQLASAALSAYGSYGMANAGVGAGAGRAAGTGINPNAASGTGLRTTGAWLG